MRMRAQVCTYQNVWQCVDNNKDTFIYTKTKLQNEIDEMGWDEMS